MKREMFDFTQKRTAPLDGERTPRVKMGRGIVTQFLILFLLDLFLISSPAMGEDGNTERPIAVGLIPNYNFLDSEFFHLKDSAGMGILLKFGITRNLFFENRIGGFECENNVSPVTGMFSQLGLTYRFPSAFPTFPIARLGAGFISVDPATVTPTYSYRPTQTTFYIIGGIGIVQPVGNKVLIELCTDVWFTPYKYRIYIFDRDKVETSRHQFTHLTISLGIIYRI